MTRVLLCTVLYILPVNSLVAQEGKDVSTMSFGHENKEHLAHKEELSKDSATDSKDRSKRSDVQAQPSELKKAATLAQQHSLNIQKKPQFSFAPYPASAAESKMWTTNQHMKAKEISPTVIAILIAAAVVVMLITVVVMKTGDDDQYKYSVFGGDKSGLSTSSSDVTSSETGSTDRELKGRMDRFEKRLSEHKRMLELGENAEDTTAAGTPTSASDGQGVPVRLSWMQKH